MLRRTGEEILHIWDCLERHDLYYGKVERNDLGNLSMELYLDLQTGRGCGIRYYDYYDENLKSKKVEKRVDYFTQSVYTMVKSKCLPLADGAGYK